jgi:transcription elongation factor GreA
LPNQYELGGFFSNTKIIKAMANQYYTQEGYDNLTNKLNELKTRGRQRMAQAIAEARDKGDLSENAEYDAAKDAQGLMESEISKLEIIVSTARVIDESTIDTSSVSLMNKVKIKNIKNGAIMAYTLVAEEEADLKLGRISINSPFAKGLLGKKVGDKAQIQAPAGMVEVEVVEITM